MTALIGAGMIAVAVPGIAAGAPAATVSAPTAMAALGDSLTQAFGAGGAGANYPAESWSTGTDGAVDSLYLRLLPGDPALSGHNWNNAISGSYMVSTNTQANTAVSEGAGYVTIWSGTNDVCTPTVAQMTSVSTFSQQFQTTLNTLGAIPGVHVLVLSIPDWLGFWNAYRTDPVAQTAWANFSNRCPDLTSSTATAADRQAIGQRIVDMNSALATVCAQFSYCHYDGGATFAMWPSLTPSDLTFDYFHLSPSGEARIAATAWQVGFSAVPVNTSLPVVSGQAVEGGLVSVSSGGWSGVRRVLRFSG